MSPCSCEEGNVIWVQKYFLDCVYGNWELVAFLVGMSSILLWMAAQAPQLVENYRNKSAEALSVWFLLQWLMGDTCNLAGCLLTGSQLPTETYTAVYFIFADTIILTQYMYYNHLNQRRHIRPDDYRELPAEVGRRRKASVAATAAAGAAASVGLVCLLASPTGSITLVKSLILPEAVLKQTYPPCGHSYRPQGLIILGNWCGWISSVFYLFSRISQIAKNMRRRSVVGLALGMFMTAVAANLTYGVSILLRVQSSEDFISKFPWLLGSLGTVSLDMTILLQSKIYGTVEDGGETQPLVVDGDSRVEDTP